MSTFQLEEATIKTAQDAMASGEVTSRSLTWMYLERIANIDKSGPTLNSVLEINPDAVFIAERLDSDRRQGKLHGPLHGIPILLKDNIDTADNMHTSAGTLALADSYALQDAFLVKKVRAAGAVLLGKTNMTELACFMTVGMPNGYSSRGGQVLNPYGPGKLDPGGSSSGSGAAVAANLCAAAIGTETFGSILSPACRNGIVGIKPTLGLISRKGIIPISYTQDTAGPMARTVEDAAILLSAMAGEDPADEATLGSGGRKSVNYTDFLDKDGLRGAMIGINRSNETNLTEAEKRLLSEAIANMREAGAVIVEQTNLPYVKSKSSVPLFEFKSALNRYLAGLPSNYPIRTLQDIIDFNHAHYEQTLKYGQTQLLRAQYETSGTLTEPAYIRERLQDWRRSRDGIDSMLQEHHLDALLCPGVTHDAAVSGYPAILIPAGFREDGMPFGISFIGTAYSEPALLRIAYAYEQVSKLRKPPVLG